MAEAVYDIIAAGVPHRVVEARADEVVFADTGLSWGQTVKLDRRAIDNLIAKSACDISAEPGPAARLAIALSLYGLKVGVLDLCTSPTTSALNRATTLLEADGNHQFGTMSDACQFLVESGSGLTATAINYGAVQAGAGKQSAMLTRAAKVLCLEDRLWDVEGGARFAASAIEGAKSAGRKIVLICKDADCVSRNRASIRELTERRIDYVVGEAATAQLLYDLERSDFLIQKIRSLSIGALLWRKSLAPLLLDGNIIGPAAADEMIDKASFWSRFLPARVAGLARNGTILNIGDEFKIEKAGFGSRPT